MKTCLHAAIGIVAIGSLLCVGGSPVMARGPGGGGGGFHGGGGFRVGGGGFHAPANFYGGVGGMHMGGGYYPGYLSPYAGWYAGSMYPWVPRSYYYGYIAGVPYASYYNYSPAYYSTYALPATETPALQQADAGSSTAQEDVAAPEKSSDDYLVEAEQDFKDGQYKEAVRAAGEAAHDLHEESRVHKVLWLSLSALGSTA